MMQAQLPYASGSSNDVMARVAEAISATLGEPVTPRDGVIALGSEDPLDRVLIEQGAHDGALYAIYAVSPLDPDHAAASAVAGLLLELHADAATWRHRHAAYDAARGEIVLVERLPDPGDPPVDLLVIDEGRRLASQLRRAVTSLMLGDKATGARS